MKNNKLRIAEWMSLYYGWIGFSVVNVVFAFFDLVVGKALDSELMLTLSVAHCAISLVFLFIFARDARQQARRKF